jgi:hypothetical protein
MPSNLHQRALSHLSTDERTAFGHFATWLEGHSEGAQILENLRAEAHMVGDEAFGDPGELSAFLRCCAGCFADEADPSAPSFAYESACEKFTDRGLRIPREHLPDTLLRYSTSRALLGRLIEQLLGDQVLADFQQDLLPPEKACALLAADWDSALLKDVMLGVKPKVFATFEHGQPAPRDDATALSRALALLFWERARTKEEILFELSYPTDSVADPRFPTVAEAGWSSLFQPAAEQIPDPGSPHTCCGWTRPLGLQFAQLEIVHDNAPVTIVETPLRWVGRIPL